MCGLAEAKVGVGGEGQRCGRINFAAPPGSSGDHGGIVGAHISRWNVGMNREFGGRFGDPGT